MKGSGCGRRVHPRCSDIFLYIIQVYVRRVAYTKMYKYMQPVETTDGRGVSGGEGYLHIYFVVTHFTICETRK